MNELALFAGAGGGILGGQLLGWKTICAVENAPYAASVLVCRQNDGLLPHFPIWDDVRTFDGTPWHGCVDVVSGGFPCQDISAAGKGAGITGDRSGLWVEMARIIGEVRPRYAFVENSPILTSRGLGVVLGDLAAMGYDARWGVLGAADVGAPHLRERIWIVADSRHAEQRQQKHSFRSTSEKSKRAIIGNLRENMADSKSKGFQSTRWSKRTSEAHHGPANAGWWESEPDVGRVAHGVEARLDRLKTIGNGQVPQCVAEAWRVLTA